MSKFTATFYGGEEVMYSGSDNSTRWYKKDLGTTLLSILNTDVDDIENIVKSYPVRPITNPDLIELGYEYSVIPPTSKEYESIIRDFPPLTAYQIEEWKELYLEVFPKEDIRSFRDCLSEIKTLIDITEGRPEYMNYSFLNRYLVECIAFSNCTIHLEEYKINGPMSSEEVESLFNQSIEDRLAQTYQHFITKVETEPNRYKYTIPEYRLEGIVLSSLLEIARCGKIVKKCKNCGRYFIPANRSDALYCDNPSPIMPELSCKEYGSQRLWYERQKDDELATLSRNILSAKSMLTKRNPDIVEYRSSYDYFRTERIKWKKAVESGSKSREEYRAWLLQMQSQKVIKEIACDQE